MRSAPVAPDEQYKGSLQKGAEPVKVVPLMDPVTPVKVIWKDKPVSPVGMFPPRNTLMSCGGFGSVPI